MSERNNGYRFVIYVVGGFAMIIALIFFTETRPTQKADEPELVENKGAIAEAQKLASARDEFKTMIKEYDLLCTPSDQEKCLVVVHKARQNMQLADALKKAKSRNIVVIADSKFEVVDPYLYVADGVVSIDANASPEEIVEFLLGPQHTDTLQPEQDVSPSQP